jgi:hypothetical protein
MMENPDTYKNLFLRQTEALVDLYVKHTGIAPTRFLQVVTKQSQYLTHQRKNSVGVATHDKFLRIASGIWPDDLAWPFGIPRPDPESMTFHDLSQEARDALEDYLKRANRDRENPKRNEKDAKNG